MVWGGFRLRKALHLKVLFAPGAFRGHGRQPLPNLVTSELHVIRSQWATHDG
jgi:hypothetical protein